MRLAMSKSFFLIILPLLVLSCVRKEFVDNRADRDLRIADTRKAQIKMNFDLINNLVVIPLRINDSGKLNFILDTGVSRTIITELGPHQQFTINYVGETEIRGLGNLGPIKALVSSQNEVQIGGITGQSLNVLLMTETVFNLSSYMGRYINGLIGSDVFNNFIVEKDYGNKVLKFNDPDIYAEEYEEKKKSDKWTYVPLEIVNDKPYVNAYMTQKDGSTVKLKLLLDSGASHSVFLYPNSNDDIVIPDKTVESYLGSGLSGEIHGVIGRVDNIILGDFVVEDPIVSYPFEGGVEEAFLVGDRNGSIGADIMRKFTMLINYADSSMLIRPNRSFDDPFTYNMSGIEITTPYINLPYYEISKIREGSPGAEAGLKVGDLIFLLNEKRAFEYTLSEITHMFHERDGMQIRMTIYRDGEYKKVFFRLRDETL